MAEVTATLVVQFRNESAGVLQAEIDARPDGYNNGRTSFVPGDSPAFLIYKSTNVTILAEEVSAGNIATLQGGLVSVTDFLTFANADEASLSKPIHSGAVYKWLGNNLGAPTIVGDTKVRLTTKGVGILKLTYNAQFLARQFAGLPTVLNGETEYQVIAVITGEAA
jgi:hypothetical protein